MFVSGFGVKVSRDITAMDKNVDIYLSINLERV